MLMFAEGLVGVVVMERFVRIILKDPKDPKTGKPLTLYPLLERAVAEGLLTLPHANQRATPATEVPMLEPEIVRQTSRRIPDGRRDGSARQSLKAWVYAFRAPARGVQCRPGGSAPAGS
jgi:hypothetical protein